MGNSVETIRIMCGNLALEKGEDFLGGGEGEGAGDELLRFRFVAAAEDLLDPGDGDGVHGELVEAEPQEDGEEFGFAGHLAADAGVDAGSVGRVDHHLEGTE